MKSVFTTIVALSCLIALVSGEEPPANFTTFETKAENYHYGGGGRYNQGLRGYGGRG